MFYPSLAYRSACRLYLLILYLYSPRRARTTSTTFVLYPSLAYPIARIPQRSQTTSAYIYIPCNVHGLHPLRLHSIHRSPTAAFADYICLYHTYISATCTDYIRHDCILFVACLPQRFQAKSAYIIPIILATCTRYTYHAFVIFIAYLPQC